MFNYKNVKDYNELTPKEDEFNRLISSIIDVSEGTKENTPLEQHVLYHPFENDTVEKVEQRVKEYNEILKPYGYTISFVDTGLSGFQFFFKRERGAKLSADLLAFSTIAEIYSDHKYLTPDILGISEDEFDRDIVHNPNGIFEYIAEYHNDTLQDETIKQAIQLVIDYFDNQDGTRASIEVYGRLVTFLVYFNNK